jgi:hypothetical protein
VQLANAKFVTVNVCKKHPGVVEEAERQKNLKGEEASQFAINVVSTDEFKQMYLEYTDKLIRQNPGHEEFLKTMSIKFLGF